MVTTNIKNLAVYFSIFVLLVSAPAQAKWIKIRTENFIVYSERNQSITLKLVEELEHFRSFIIEFSHSKKIINKAPFRVFVTRKRKYWKLTGLRSTVGLFTMGANGPFAIMYANEHGRKFELYSLNVILHEYVHYLNSHNKNSLAPWLEEGLAEFLSASEAIEGGMIVGKVALARLPALKLAEWYSTKEIMEAERLPGFASLFYSQSWLLVHMLHFDPRFKTNFQDLVNKLVTGTPPEKALKKVYGINFDTLDVALREYFDSGKLSYSTMPWVARDIKVIEYTKLSKSESNAIVKSLRKDLKRKPKTDED